MRWSTWQTTPPNRPARVAAQRFLDGRDAQTDLHLCGSVGAGKTRLACLGWRILRVNQSQVRSGLALPYLRAALVEGALPV